MSLKSTEDENSDWRVGDITLSRRGGWYYLICENYGSPIMLDEQEVSDLHEVLMEWTQSEKLEE